MKRVLKNGKIHIEFTIPSSIYTKSRGFFKSQWTLFTEYGPLTPFGLALGLGLGTATAFAFGYTQGKDHAGMSAARRKEAIFTGCLVGGGLGMFFGTLWPSFAIIVPGLLIYKAAEYTSRGKFD